MTSIVWGQCSSWLMVTCVSSQRHTCTGQIESYCLLESVEKLIHLHCITQVWTIVWVIFTGAVCWIIAWKMSFPSSNPNTCEYNYWRTEGMKSTHQTEGGRQLHIVNGSIYHWVTYRMTSQVAPWLRIRLPMQEMQENWVRSLGQEDPVE